MMLCAMRREPRDPCRRMIARRNADAKSRTNPRAETQRAIAIAIATRRRVGIDLPRIDRIGAPLLRFVCGVCGGAVGRAAQRLGRVEATRAEERWPADAVDKDTDSRSHGTDNRSKGTDNRSKGTDKRTKGTEHPRHHERRSGVRLGVRSA